MTDQADLRGKVRVPADLDAVTAIGDEDHSEIDPAAVERIWQAARHWYQAGMHPAIQLCLRHNGKVVLNRAIGHGWGNAPTTRPMPRRSPSRPIRRSACTRRPRRSPRPSCTCSSNAVVFSLDDRVCDYIPTYTSHGKDRTTIRHVMTHSAGVPFPTGPKAGPQARGRPRVRAGASSATCGRCTGRGSCTFTTR